MACLLLADRFCACELFRDVNQCFEGVCIVIVRNALHDRCDALKPHTSVDRWLGQGHVRPIILPLELHEHEVPYFDKTVAIFIGASRRSAENMIAMVIEYFAAWPTRSSIAH